MTETKAPEQRFGRCLNEGRCELADSNAHIPLAPDAPLTCPKCQMPIVVRAAAGKPLVDVGDGPKPVPRRLMIFGGVLAVLIGAGLAFNLFAAPEEETEVAEEAQDFVPPADEVVEREAITERRTTVFLFTVGATPETREKLAPALATAFMESKGCTSVSEKPVSGDRQRLSCDNDKGLRFFVDIASADAETAFDQRPGRQVDLLVTTANGAGTRPRDPTLIGFAPVAVVVNAGNPLRKLTLAQVGEVFGGDADSFRDVGGPSATIRRVAGPETSIEVQAVLPLLPGGRLASTTRRLADSPAVAAAVAGDPDAIGLVNPIDAGSVRALAIAGSGAAVLPSPAAITNGSYPLSRRLKIEIPRGSKIRFAQPFADFVTTADGQAVVRGAGYLTLPSGEMNRSKAPPTPY